VVKCVRLRLLRFRARRKRHARGPNQARSRSEYELTTPGRPSIRDAHYPPRAAGALERTPRARSAEERAFPAIGPGAERRLIAAAAAGTTKLRRKLAEATARAKLHIQASPAFGPDGVIFITWDEGSDRLIAQPTS